MSQRFTLMTAALLAAALVSVDALAATASAGARSYEDLALNGAGDRVAALESVNPPDAAKRAHASVVVRDAGSGKVLATYDPCPHCLYNYPSWSPDGKALAFIGNDSKSGNATLYRRPATARRAPSARSKAWPTPRAGRQMASVWP